MISHFFIDRPIFASVLLDRLRAGRRRGRGHAAGGAISRGHSAHGGGHCLYPGANAYTVRDTVAAPIEEQVNGVEGMMYMSSQSTNDGAYRLAVTFKLGMDSDMAQVLVQNRVSLALPVIPPLVQNEGINVKKVSPNTMMIVNLVSKDEKQLRCHVPEQLRHHLHPRRVGAAAGRGRRDLLRPARLQPAGLARSRQTGRLGAHGRRRRGGHRPAKPAGRRRPDRPAARPQGPAVPIDHQYLGPA